MDNVKKSIAPSGALNIRNVDKALIAKVKAKGIMAGLELRETIISLMEDYVEGKKNEKPKQ